MNNALVNPFRFIAPLFCGLDFSKSAAKIRICRSKNARKSGFYDRNISSLKQIIVPQKFVLLVMYLRTGLCAIVESSAAIQSSFVTIREIVI